MFDRIGLPAPDRANLYHFGVISEWNLLIVGGSNFPDIELLGPEGEELEQLNLEDSWRAQVPFRENSDSTFQTHQP